MANPLHKQSHQKIKTKKNHSHIANDLIKDLSIAFPETFLIVHVVIADDCKGYSVYHTRSMGDFYGVVSSFCHVV